MKELFSSAPIVRNQSAAIQELYQKNVVPSYGRFDLVLDHGAGSYLWDVNGRRYLDLASGIAVCSLGHASSDITDALIEQSRKLVHVSNLYYTAPGGELAAQLVRLIAPGKVFFSNSGAEANEGLYKVARKFGHDEGRFEIITTINSFHGRTLAGISATGQDKVKKGFEPAVPGFRHVPYNDLTAVEAAISPATAALLIEGIQGESGVTPAKAEFLLGLRDLCDRKNLLLMMDGVQDGHFRTGRFTAYQRLLEDHPSGKDFLPDAYSMAKSLGGGFPMGAFWVRDKYSDLLGPGTHATTFGGSPLAAAVGAKILQVIERDKLEENSRKLGSYILTELNKLRADFPNVIQEVRGYGLMIGIELAAGIPGYSKSEKTHALQFVQALHEAGVLTVPAGTQVARLLPALNLKKSEADEGLATIRSVVSRLAL
ncbi:MAG: aspartate aminotransferase family protein [Verrucomicrobiales bacterium]